jgi:hypothetical protein
VALLSDPL